MPIGPAEKSSEKGQRHQLRRPFSPVRFRSKNCRICRKFLGFPPHGGTPSLLLRLYGGGRGIRTPGTLSGTAVFKMYPSPPPSFVFNELRSSSLSRPAQASLALRPAELLTPHTWAWLRRLHRT